MRSIDTFNKRQTKNIEFLFLFHIQNKLDGNGLKMICQMLEILIEK